MRAHEIRKTSGRAGGEGGLEPRMVGDRREEVGEMDGERRVDVGVRQEVVQVGEVLEG